jgi:hypothetical protein
VCVRACVQVRKLASEQLFTHFNTTADEADEKMQQVKETLRGTAW